MESKKAATILISLRSKYSLTSEENEAISNAIGALSWMALAENKIKGMGAKRRAERKRDTR